MQFVIITFNDQGLPRRARLDVQRVDSGFLAPLFAHVCNELTSIVAANIFWRATYRGRFIRTRFAIDAAPTKTRQVIKRDLKVSLPAITSRQPLLT